MTDPFGRPPQRLPGSSQYESFLNYGVKILLAADLYSDLIVPDSTVFQFFQPAKLGRQLQPDQPTFVPP
jgi:hypothetical protein